MADISSPDSDAEDQKPFADILAKLQTERLSILAATVRGRLEPGNDHQDPTIEKPIFGSFHALFPIVFDDGTRWLAKFPVNSTTGKWDEISSRALSTEAKTMQLLKRVTSIPLPEVFAFSDTTDNMLHSPYILMSFLPGKPLYDVWFGHHLRGVSLEDQARHRTRVLEGIADAMWQLGHFTYKTGGFLNFDHNGNDIGTGALRYFDHQAVLDRVFIHKNDDDSPIYVESDVTLCPDQYYTSPMDIHADCTPHTKGIKALLRLLISWIPEAAPGDPQFVLAHPDFDIQDFLVSDDGELQGVIDWDNVAAVPMSVGNEQYPGWLTRDWDPMMYGYEESMDEGMEPKGVWEDSPAELARWRKVYRDLMAAKRSQSPGPAKYPCPAEHPRPDWTANSLVAQNLAIAANDPRSRDGIVSKIFQEMAASSEECEGLSYLDLVDGLADGSMDESTVEKVKKGFLKTLEDSG